MVDRVMACGVFFVWLNVFWKIYDRGAVQKNAEEMNEGSFTATIKSPHEGEEMIVFKGGN